MRTLQNTIVVLLATVLTSVAVYAGVSALGSTSAALTVSTDAAAAEQTCPRTGCTSVGCHATDGGSGSVGGHGLRGNQGMPGSTGTDSEQEWPTT